MIYLLEDDENIRELVCYSLNVTGNEATGFAAPSLFWEAVSKALPELVILDVMLPEEDGLQVLSKLRGKDATADIPVIMLTAKGSEFDKVTALDAGADDYLPKPFAASEFLARVRALTRRSNTYASNVLTLGNVTLDCSQYILRTSKEESRLNNKEYQLMELFLRHPRQVFSLEHLMDKVWDLDTESEMNVVWTYIAVLRKKLKQIDANVMIRTIRGAGYTLEEM